MSSLRVVFVAQRFWPLVGRAANVMANLAAVVMSVILAYAGWRYLMAVELAEDTMVTYVEVTFGATTALEIPTWIFVAGAPLAFALTAWHFAILTLREWMGFPPQCRQSPERARRKRNPTPP